MDAVREGGAIKLDALAAVDKVRAALGTRQAQVGSGRTKAVVVEADAFDTPTSRGTC